MNVNRYKLFRATEYDDDEQRRDHNGSGRESSRVLTQHDDLCEVLGSRLL